MTHLHRRTGTFALAAAGLLDGRKVVTHWKFAEQLQARYPDAQLLDIAAPCMSMRLIKSVEEHAMIRHGARIADIGGAAVVEALQDQVPEYEVALHATQAMVREIARVVGYDSQGYQLDTTLGPLPWVSSSPSSPSSTPGEQP